MSSSSAGVLRDYNGEGSSSSAAARTPFKGASRRSNKSSNSPGGTVITSSTHRRRSRQQLSAKQLDKIVRNLSAVQKSVGHFHAEDADDLSHIQEDVNNERDDEEGHFRGPSDERDSPRLAPYALLESDEAGISTDRVVLQALAGIGSGDTELDEHELQKRQTHETSIWLQRRGVDKSLVKGQGKGPDGVALARVAAKAFGRKEDAPQDAFLHEAGFVFNPLMQRLPQPSPRKQVQRSAHFASDLREAGPSRLPQRRALHASSDSRQSSDDKAFGDTLRPRAATSLTSTADHLDDAAAERSDLATAPKVIQEALILEDLLFVFMGIEGQYIQFASSYHPEELGSRLKGSQYSIDEGLDRSLRDLVLRMLPLAAHYTSIYAFVETQSSLEFGTVAHALCAALRSLLKEYQVLLVQLESQLSTSPDFTLQQLWFYIHPTLRTFALAYSFLREVIAISHANLIDSDDEEELDGNGSSGDDDDDNSDSDADSFERRRRELLREDGDEAEDSVVGGVVRGGELISMLYHRYTRMSGDDMANKLFSTLLHAASQPYARIALRWITTGQLADAYDEFLVIENPQVTQASLESDPTDEYWERRYMLRDEYVLWQKENERQQGLDLDGIIDDNGTRGLLTGGAKIPAFLEPWKRKILLAGRYLNVIRECGKEMPTAGEDQIDWTHEDDISIVSDAFYHQIELAYQRANTALLGMLMTEHEIVPRLRSMKHYFFQSQSDFFSSFLETAGRELRKEVVAGKVRDVTIMRLQSHLGMVLGSSNCVGYDDPFREDVRVQLAAENAYDQLKRIAEIKGGIEAARAQAKLARNKDKERMALLELLQFDLHVKFPVSLIISKRNVLRWQFLQRPIIHLKATERALCDVWMEHQDSVWRDRERGSAPLYRWKMRVFRLRHRILFFVQQVLAFITTEVIEPNWRALEVKMARAKTVDEFMKDHFDFLNLCRKECMLTDLRFVEMMSKLMSVAVIFCENRVRFRDQLQMERESALAAKQSHPEVRYVINDDVMAFLTRLEAHWEKRLSTFKDIVALLSTTDNPAALPLSYRLQSA